MGAILDGACAVWGYDSCGKRGTCFEYDVNEMSKGAVILGLSCSGKTSG